MNYTIIGFLSILVWATCPTMFLITSHIPPFQLMTIIMFFACLATSGVTSITKTWNDLLTLPRPLFASAITGICLNDIFYCLAFRYAPAAETELLTYTWPVMILLSLYFFYNQPISQSQIIAVVLSVCGIVTLLAHELGTQFAALHLWGYLFALLAAACWAYFSLIIKQHNHFSSALYTVVMAIGFLTNATLMLLFETPVTLTYTDLIMCGYMGTITHSLSYFSWELGLSKGDTTRLTVSVYWIPLLSVLLLVSLGQVALTTSIIVALSFMLTSSMILIYNPTPVRSH